MLAWVSQKNLLSVCYIIPFIQRTISRLLLRLFRPSLGRVSLLARRSCDAQNGIAKILLFHYIQHLFTYFFKKNFISLIINEIILKISLISPKKIGKIGSFSEFFDPIRGTISEFFGEMGAKTLFRAFPNGFIFSSEIHYHILYNEIYIFFGYQITKKVVFLHH